MSANALDRFQVGKVLHLAKLDGWGGYCAAAAMAINNVLLDGDGVILAAVNKKKYEDEGELIGHVVAWEKVVYADGEEDDLLWDSSGETSEDVVEAWGMLDPSEYPELTEEEAHEAIFIVLTKEELATFPGIPERLKAYEKRLRQEMT
jgi:hypothetical protein